MEELWRSDTQTGKQIDKRTPGNYNIDLKIFFMEYNNVNKEKKLKKKLPTRTNM